MTEEFLALLIQYIDERIAEEVDDPDCEYGRQSRKFEEALYKMVRVTPTVETALTVDNPPAK